MGFDYSTPLYYPNRLSTVSFSSLFPTLKDFKERHPLIRTKIFLGDAAFDTIEIYKSLFEDFKFQKAFIPLKVKLSLDNIDYTFNENGIPCCPHDSSLPMKREGSKSHLKSKLPTMKFVCPKMKWEYNKEDKSTISKTASALLIVKPQTRKQFTPIYF